MLHATLNLGILAHVDAGKTTLTERLLYDAGVIAAPGSVDRGTTQTDTLALERERGITIKSAVVSFPIDGVTVNLIDTPGHPDFIAEVERVLGVLDGVVLVVSAVEGVQAQTLVLMRALQRLEIPTLFFVNKTDRAGADVERVVGEMRARLGVHPVPLASLDAEQLAERDDELLAAFLDGRPFDVEEALADLTRRALVQPVVHGSALTGDGVDDVRAAIVRFLPTSSGDSEAPLDATVFKIDRGAKGDKVAWMRLFAGGLQVRDRIGDAKVTQLEVFDHGGPVRRQAASAGEIAKVWGLHGVRIGDRLGGAEVLVRQQFAPPTLEAVVEPVDPDAGNELRIALEQLAEQDPLIGLHQNGSELSVSIYGDVQKEVLEATLARDYGLAVTFLETRPICVERPVGVGEAGELMNAPTNPFNAQLTLRIEPAPDNSGIAFDLGGIPHDRIPLYAYKRREEFESAMAGYVRDALRGGLHGWAVIDCVVTLVDCWYSLADGPPSRRGPLSMPSDFRGLTSHVLARALAAAGTVVCEPILRIRVDVPAASLGSVLAAAHRLDGSLDAATLEGELPAVQLSALQRQLPGLTRGEGVIESSFAGYRPAVSAVPG
ncbi:MAG TPA: translation factor GTPase family protein [Gaiellaceae bacterium]|nr:translation factor GTPase family protein [Gaiellaceae bacterium]